MRDRPAKPTAQRIAEGMRGHRPLNDKEPQYKLGIPKCPSHLSKDAKTEWRRIAPMLDASGVLTEADVIPLGNLCEAFTTLKKAQAQLEKTGLLVKTQSGFVQQSPLVSIVNQQMQMVNKLCREFGMSPSSRTQIQVQEQNSSRSSPRSNRGVDPIHEALIAGLPN